MIVGLESKKMDTVPEEVCPWTSVPDTLKLKRPVAVGVPLIKPEEVIDSPGGRVPPVWVQVVGGISIVNESVPE